MQKVAVVVDDSRVARMTLKKLLVVDGFQVVEFASGEEVLDYLFDVESNPDIIFMDVMMEGMDGLTATRKLKENSRLRTIPVVMCTGNDTAEDRQKAVDAGAITALSKPPIAEALANILADVHVTVPVEQVVPDAVAVESSTIPDDVINELRTQLEQQLHEQVQIECRQLVNEMMDNAVAERVNSEFSQREGQLSEQITNKAIGIIESSAADAFKIAAEENVTDIAATAIQQIVGEADLPKQVSDFLAQEGEEWLTNQEEELGSQLSAQLDQHIPLMVTEHLNTNLESIITPLLNKDAAPQAVDNTAALDELKIQQIVSKSLHNYTATVIEPLVSSQVKQGKEEQEKSDVGNNDAQVKLEQNISTLKNMVICLGMAVVGLIVAMVI